MRKKFLVASLAGALLVILLAATESGRWRLAVLGLKLSGKLPTHSWAEVISGLRLCAWGPCHRPLVMGEVTLARTDPDNPCPVLWRTPFGPMRGFLNDQKVLDHFQRGSWIVNPESPQVQPGDVVLEVGAWLGNFTRYALDRGASLVVAFEPDPMNRACFEQNFVDEIQLGRVVVIEAAAWSHSGQVRLANIGPNNEEKSRKGMAVAPGGPIEVESVTIDETVDQLGLERIDLINIDIEGGEEQALLGARRTIRRFRPVLVVCIHHLPGDREKIPQTVFRIDSHYRVEKTFLQGFFRPIREARKPLD